MKVDVYFKMSINGYEDSEDPKELIDRIKYMTDSDFRAECELDHADVSYGCRSCENCIFSDITETQGGSMMANCVFTGNVMQSYWEAFANDCDHYVLCPDTILDEGDFQ